MRLSSGPCLSTQCGFAVKDVGTTDNNVGGPFAFSTWMAEESPDLERKNGEAANHMVSAAHTMS